MFKILKYILVLVLLACAGSDKIPTEIVSYGSHYVDQLFIDYNGYRTLETQHNGVVTQHKFFKASFRCLKTPDTIPIQIANELKLFVPNKPICNNLIIFKDLEPGTRGFVNYITYKHSKFSCVVATTKGDYAEFHLPVDYRINPGLGETGGKYSKPYRIHEVK